MKLAPALMFFLAMFSSQIHAGGYVIGNGGDGYLIKGSIFVTDLLEVGLEKIDLSKQDPIAPKFLQGLKQLALPFDYPQEALARKLTELERRAPGLAECLILAMGSFRWRMVDVPIGKVKDIEGRTVGLPDSMRVQLAVRLSKVIRIQAMAWKKMNETNQVALLLHEAIYSLVAPRVIGGSKTIMMQSSRETRGLVGLAFDQDLSNRLADDASLTLGTDALGPGTVSPMIPKWALELINEGQEKQHFIYPFYNSTVDSVGIFIAATCHKIIDEQHGAGKSLVVGGELQQATLEVGDFSYVSPFGEQTAITVNSHIVRSLQFRHDFVDQPGCENALRSYVENFRSLGLLVN